MDSNVAKLTCYKKRNFLIDIVEYDVGFEFWLGCIRSGIKRCVLSVEKELKDGKVMDMDSFKGIVDEYLDTEMQSYVEEICELDECDYDSSQK